MMLKAKHLGLLALACLPLSGAQCIQEGGFECIFSAGCETDGNPGEGIDDPPDDDPPVVNPETCEELDEAFTALVRQEAADNGSCAEHTDCEQWAPTINCGETAEVSVCAVAIATDQLAGSKDEIDGLVDQLCAQVDESCVVTPDCEEGLFAACVDGGCQMVEDLPPDLSCEEAAVQWSVAITDSLTDQTTCEVNEDCALWTPSLACEGASFGECEIAVNADSLSSLGLELSSTNEDVCASMGGQACLSTPSCPPVVAAICDEGVCVTTETPPVLDGGACPASIDPWVGSNGGTIACVDGAICSADCDESCEFEGATTCGFTAFCSDGVWGGDDGFGFSEHRPPTRCFDNCSDLMGESCDLYENFAPCGQCEAQCNGSTWVAPFAAPCEG